MDTDERLPEDIEDNLEEKQDPLLNVQEILLLNKKSGLPVFSRVYKETSGKDPTLIAGLMAAIVQFGEMIGHNMELNDIGVREGSRIFVRSQKNLVCLLTITNFPISFLTTRKFIEIVDDLASRIFETIRMLASLPMYENGGLIEEISFDITDEALEENKASIFPQLGKTVDNIVMETTATLFVDEGEIEEELNVMEETNSTYLGSEYSGTSNDIINPISSNFNRMMKNFRRLLKNSLRE
ncbi:MAG: hypothetical protein ACFFFG_07360 [Candidatus Thorarchaeota archaeon]